MYQIGSPGDTPQPSPTAAADPSAMWGLANATNAEQVSQPVTHARRRYLTAPTEGRYGSLSGGAAAQTDTARTPSPSSSSEGSTDTWCCVRFHRQAVIPMSRHHLLACTIWLQLWLLVVCTICDQMQGGWEGAGWKRWEDLFPEWQQNNTPTPLRRLADLRMNNLPIYYFIMVTAAGVLGLQMYVLLLNMWFLVPKVTKGLPKPGQVITVFISMSLTFSTVYWVCMLLIPYGLVPAFPPSGPSAGAMANLDSVMSDFAPSPSIDNGVHQNGFASQHNSDGVLGLGLVAPQGTGLDEELYNIPYERQGSDKHSKPANGHTADAIKTLRSRTKSSTHTHRPGDSDTHKATKTPHSEPLSDAGYEELRFMFASVRRYLLCLYFATSVMVCSGVTDVQCVSPVVQAVVMLQLLLQVLMLAGLFGLAVRHFTNTVLRDHFSSIKGHGLLLKNGNDTHSTDTSDKSVAMSRVVGRTRSASREAPSSGVGERKWVSNRTSEEVVPPIVVTPPRPKVFEDVAPSTESTHLLAACSQRLTEHTPSPVEHRRRADSRELSASVLSTMSQTDDQDLLRVRYMDSIVSEQDSPSSESDGVVPESSPQSAATTLRHSPELPVSAASPEHQAVPEHTSFRYQSLQQLKGAAGRVKGHLMRHLLLYVVLLQCVYVGVLLFSDPAVFHYWADGADRESRRHRRNYPGHQQGKVDGAAGDMRDSFAVAAPLVLLTAFQIATLCLVMIVTFSMIRRIHHHHLLSMSALVQSYLSTTLVFTGLYTLLILLEPNAFSLIPSLPNSYQKLSVGHTLWMYLYYSVSMMTSFGMSVVYPTHFVSRMVVIAHMLVGAWYRVVILGVGSSILLTRLQRRIDRYALQKQRRQVMERRRRNMIFTSARRSSIWNAS